MHAQLLHKAAWHYPKLYDGQGFQVGCVILGLKDVDLPSYDLMDVLFLISL